ncbi:HNH endonuclease [Streptomyces sp. NPDC006784]|uniref:HNH endonuclease n=1 Tax=Streptomyces sp. NPDC006784 TaxID=3364764 RepID=UPI0036A2392F
MGSRNGAHSPEQAQYRARRIAARPGQGWRCFYCRRPFDDTRPWTFDHYIPYRLWRTGRLRNLVLACDPCNQAKGDALPLLLALLLIKRVRENEVWWRACMPAAADDYREAA